MKRSVCLALLLCLTLAAPAGARGHLSKRHARAQALGFIAPFVDLLDINRTIPTRMVPPRECRRISHVTIRCRFTAVVDGRRVRSWVRVHRQRDGLLGFYTTLDVFRDGV